MQKFSFGVSSPVVSCAYCANAPLLGWGISLLNHYIQLLTTQVAALQPLFPSILAVGKIPTENANKANYMLLCNHAIIISVENVPLISSLQEIPFSFVFSIMNLQDSILKKA